MTGDRPEAPVTGAIREVTPVRRRVDGGGEDALSRRTDRMRAPWWAEAIMCRGEETFGGRRRRSLDRVEFRQLDNEHARDFHQRVFGSDGANAVRIPILPDSELLERHGLVKALRAFQDEAVIGLAPRIVDPCHG